MKPPIFPTLRVKLPVVSGNSAAAGTDAARTASAALPTETDNCQALIAVPPSAKQRKHISAFPNFHGPQQRAIQANVKSNRRMDMRRMDGPITSGHDMSV